MESITLKPKEQELLRSLLKKAAGETSIKSPHEVYRFDDKTAGIFVIAYRTGKVVYKKNGKISEFLDRVLSGSHSAGEWDYFLGTDEAGKGEWWGPLVVCCAALGPEDKKTARRIGARDSKDLKGARLERIALKLKDAGIRYRTLSLKPETYNRMYAEFRQENKNINDLLAWGHYRVIKDLLSVLEYDKARIVIDQFDIKKTGERIRSIKAGEIEMIQKEKAEYEIEVACASIMAKHVYEKEVDLLNKGYGIDLRNTRPGDIPKDILPKVAKLHFKNVPKA